MVGRGIWKLEVLDEICIDRNGDLRTIIWGHAFKGRHREVVTHALRGGHGCLSCKLLERECFVQARLSHSF